MAKNKYQLLAIRMKQLIHDIEDFFDEVAEVLNLVQFDFSQESFIVDAPLMDRQTFATMNKCHAIGLRYYSPFNEVRQACKKYPCVGVIDSKASMKDLYRSDDSIGKWVIPWKVKVTLPNLMIKFIDQGRSESLLYCPDASELSNEIDWFENEDYINTLNYQLKISFEITQKENAARKIIRENLDQSAFSYFPDVVQSWQDDPEGHDTISENPRVVYKKEFAPKEGQTIAIAYENLLRTLKKRKLRNYEYLMNLWKEELEDIIFSRVDWNDNEKALFLKQWRDSIFDNQKGLTVSKGRWIQSMAIDRITASTIIRYFVDRFLEDPSKNKVDGEIACCLWTFVWLSYEAGPSSFNVESIRDLTTKQLNLLNPIIFLDEEEVEISLGLFKLLDILRGKGKSQRACKLFPYVSKDILEDALKRASDTVLGEECNPILPGAFLSFPHPHKNLRIPRKQHEAIRSKQKIVAESSDMRCMILKELHKNQKN